jgi:5-methylcytosine-specific restriction endonuclease McrA
MVPCAACGALVRRPARLLRRRPRVFCSRRCAAAFLSGPRHPMARDGTAHSPGSAWAQLAEDVRRRDGYRCRWCGRTQAENGRRLAVDHIVPRRAFPSAADADAPGNLVSLCDSCHARKTATAERLWLRGDALDLARYARWVGRPGP